MSRAVRVIEFLASLKGMDHLQRALGDTGAGAIDLWTANVITPAPDDEEGEVLSLERADGQRFIVNTHKLAETLMLRHARELAALEPDSGTVQRHLNLIRSHFDTKVGTTG